MKAISLFSGMGVGEFNLKKSGTDIVVANELIESRAKAYSYFFPETKMVNGDINNNEIQEEIIKESAEKNIDLIIITPPCQGVSTVGKNKTLDDILNDPRNHLIISALNIVDEILPPYILIENVPRYRKMSFPIDNKLYSLEEILKLKYGKDYHIKIDVLDVANYGVPQSRKRIIYRLFRKNLNWNLPLLEKNHISLEEAIGHLPSIEAGESSNIKNHWAREHPMNQVRAMRHTPTGKSALDNEIHFPKKPDGSAIKGFRNTYKRMKWDVPAPTVTMRNEIISSQQNVHPGRPLEDNTWSDARVLTLRELLIVSSLNPDLDSPEFISDTAFRQLIGEGVPPLFMEKVLKGIT